MRAMKMNAFNFDAELIADIDLAASNKCINISGSCSCGRELRCYHP